MESSNVHHLLAYTKSMAAAAALADLTGITDQVATLLNNHYVLPQAVRLLGAYGQGATMSALQLNTPSLRAVALPFIEPFKVATLPGSLPPFVNFRGMGPLLPPVDEVALNASNTGAGEQQWAGLWVGDQSEGVPPGPVYTLKLTGTTTVVANVWNTCVLTVATSLPAGKYAIIGMRCVSATGVLARIIFSGGGFRPGCIAVATEATDDGSIFRYGKFGLYGSFQSINLPALEILCTGADTAQTVYWDVVKIG